MYWWFTHNYTYTFIIHFLSSTDPSIWLDKRKIAYISGWLHIKTDQDARFPRVSFDSLLQNFVFPGKLHFVRYWSYLVVMIWIKLYFTRTTGLSLFAALTVKTVMASKSKPKALIETPKSVMLLNAETVSTVTFNMIYANASLSRQNLF